MNETTVHTPDSPLHPDAFAHMVGTERVAPTNRAWGRSGPETLRYRVEGVKFKGASIRNRASVTVWGRVVENRSVTVDGGEATTYGAYLSEIFYTNPETETETETDSTPREFTDSDINVYHVGSTVTVVADASPYDGVKAVSYTGTLVKLTDNRAYVRREGCGTARPFVRGQRFRYLLHADV